MKGNCAKPTLQKKSDLPRVQPPTSIDLPEPQDFTPTFVTPLSPEASAHYLMWYKEHRKAYRETAICIDAHIIPTFGRENIADISTKDIREWHQRLAEQPARKRSSRLSDQQYHEEPLTPDAKRSRRASANRILTVLKATLNKAYHDELVYDNAAWKRIKPFSNVDQPIIRFLRAEECTRLINACEGDFRDLLQAALLTGARYGEIVRLRADDINTDNRSIFIKPSKSNKGRNIPYLMRG